MTERSPSLPATGRAVPGRSSALREAFLSGMLAAGLGLGVITVLVLVLWITSPYPDSGPSGALHIAADLWLLAQGADLLRNGTLSDVATPVGLSPLLLGMLPCWLLYRAARHVFEPPEADDLGWAPDQRDQPDHRHRSGHPDQPAHQRYSEGGDRPDRLAGHRHAGPEPGREPPGAVRAEALPAPMLEPAAAFGWVAGGYLLVTVAAVAYASTGPVRVAPLSALLHLPAFTVVTVAVGAWTAVGHPRAPLSPRLRAALARLPGRVRAWSTRGRAAAALRAAAGAVVALLGGGALLTAVSMAGHAGSAQYAFRHLSDGWSGRLAVLLLSVALLPNAVVWAAAYGLGPGFAVGAGAVFGPLRPSGSVGLPYFPLLAAVPTEGTGGLPARLLAGSVPVAAGLSVAWFIATAAVRRPSDGSRHRPGGPDRGWLRRRGHPEQPSSDVPGRAAAGPVQNPGWGMLETALTAALASIGCGVAMALLAWAAGGPVGRETLATFGPSGWRTGVAALGWTALLGVPGSVLLRWWRLRKRTAPAVRSAPAATSAVPAGGGADAAPGPEAGPASGPGVVGAATEVRWTPRSAVPSLKVSVLRCGRRWLDLVPAADTTTPTSGKLARTGGEPTGAGKPDGVGKRDGTRGAGGVGDGAGAA